MRLWVGLGTKRCRKGPESEILDGIPGFVKIEIKSGVSRGVGVG